MKRHFYPTAFENFLSRFPSLFEEEPSLDMNSSGLSVYEDKQHLYVEAALPGISENEVEITYEKGRLTIEAEKKEETEKDKKYFRKANRVFSYQVLIPQNIDETVDPEATFSNGIMKVQFKRKEGSSKRKIPIKKG